MGVKGGQLLGSTFELFGMQVAAETRHLKDRRTAMTLNEIWGQLDDSLNRDQLHDLNIEIEKVAGSASVKTVLFATVQNNRRVAMGVQASAVPDRIRGNLRLAKLFLSQLHDAGLIKKSAFLLMMVDMLELQLQDEIDLRIEGKRLIQAAKVYDAYNRDFKSVLGRWKFRVPRLLEDLPLKKNLIFYEPGKGAHFTDLPEEIRRELGPILVRSSLTMLFRYGWFDADRHEGNWLVDVENHIIEPLDFGQLEDFSASALPWRWDPRLTLAGFLKAINDQDANAMVHYALLMKKEGAPITVDRVVLVSRFQDVLKLMQTPTLDFGHFVDQLMSSMVESGLVLDRRFGFGALKGLTVLYKENYFVSSDEFKAMLHDEIQRLYIAKAPAILWGRIQKFVETPIASASLKPNCTRLLTEPPL